MDHNFKNKGFESGGILNVTPRQALDLCHEGAILVDVREDYMNRYKMFDVPEILYCPFSLLSEMHIHLPREKAMIFADASGLHSREAVQFLLEKGYGDRIANMAGGLVEWERDELPLIIDRDEKLSGACMCQLKPRNKKS